MGSLNRELPPLFNEPICVCFGGQESVFLEHMGDEKGLEIKGRLISNEMHVK